MPVATPPEITEPFGKNAGAGFITLPIPVPTQSTPGAASFNDGFPPLTMTPIAAGGIPPFGQDMNGILYMVSAHCAYIQAGQPYLWSATVAAAIGGYAIGTILGRSDGSGTWINLVANNASNPDAGGAGWAPGLSYGQTSIAGLTNADHVLTAAEASRGVIFLDGALTGNVNIIFPTNLETWLIINETTGAHTVTAKTAAGTGVVIQQGGRAAPTGVYGDGTNLYPTAPPAPIPVDTAPTPNTLVERTNLGYVYAVYYNQNTALENPSVGAVFVQSTAADGFLRKISLGNLEAQMLLQNIGGQLTAPQLSQAAFAQFITGSIAANTSLLFKTAAGNFILKLGYTFNAASQFTTNFPTPFPNNCFGVLSITKRSDPSLVAGANLVDVVTTTGFLGTWHQINTGPQTGQFGGFYIAWGN